MWYSRRDGAVLELLEISPGFNLVIPLSRTISTQEVELEVISLAFLLFVVNVVGCGKDEIGRDGRPTTHSQLLEAVQECQRAYRAMKQRFDVA